MDNIQGQDHKALAAVLDYRVGELEKKVDATGEHVMGVAGKMDVLLGAHEDTQRAVKEIHVRLDRHIDGQLETPETVVALLGKHPWLIPVLMVLGATMFGSTAFLTYLER